ncbi:MAG TPA: sulfurtransferase complex subunit TusB [Acidiferrobacter sp.]|nr:sulfurtransferase complex subunit TusB [Acidiferrobacter sp.]
MLHTMNKSPLASRTFEQCLAHVRPDGAVLLIEDGVYAATVGTAAGALIAQSLGTFPVYVLGPDLEARGFTGKDVIEGVATVDYAGFVKLVTEHEAVQAWL